MPTRLILLTVLFLLGLAAPASAVIVPGKGMAGVELGECIDDVIEDARARLTRRSARRTCSASSRPTRTSSRGLKLEFRRGPGECLVLDSIRTTKGEERTKEGVGKGTRKQDAAEEAEGREVPHVQAAEADPICWLGSFTPSKPITEFRIDSKGRVNNVRVAIVID